MDKPPAADPICSPSPEMDARKPLQYPEKRISLKNMETTTALFKALAHDTRLRILNLLLDGEVCVCRIMEILDLPQSTASRHLGILKNAGLLDDRREGIWVHYSLARNQRPLALQILSALQDHLPLLDICRSDRRRLQQPRSPKKLYG